MFDTHLPLASACSLLARAWPDPLDRTTIVVYLTLVLVLPAIGYLLMVADLRAYWRAMRGVLIVVRHCGQRMPEWVRAETPPCLRTLGLVVGCSEAEVKQAYRRQAELLHPDRGGDRRRFTQLQGEFELALHFVRQQQLDSRRSRPY